MGKRTAKISPIKKTYPSYKGQETIRTSLSKNGYSFYPGTKRTFMPYPERNGEYRTGLDVNALYIKKIDSDEEREAEIEYVRSERERIDKMINHAIDLNPQSSYYRDKFNVRPNDTGKYFSIVHLMDTPMEFDLDSAFDNDETGTFGAITYAWMRVHPDVAPSMKCVEENINSYRCDSVAQCRYFVDDEAYEAEQDYKHRTELTKAVAKWGDMTPTRQLKVAVLLGISVNAETKPSVIFNQGYEYINSTSARKKDTNVKEFLKVASYDEQYMDIAYVVAEAMKYNIYTTKEGRIWNGKVEMGKTVEDVIQKLNTVEFQQDYILLKESVNDKRALLIS